METKQVNQVLHRMRVRRIGELKRWAKKRIRWHILLLVVGPFFSENCHCQERGPMNFTAQETNSIPSFQALAVGTWRWTPEEHDLNFIKVQLSGDGSWKWSVISNDPRTPSDTLSGTWLIHERVLVLRSDKAAGDKVYPNMAFVFDIKSATPHTLTLTNCPFSNGEVIWKRIVQPGGTANGSQPIRSETNRTSSAAGSRR